LLCVSIEAADPVSDSIKEMIKNQIYRQAGQVYKSHIKDFLDNVDEALEESMEYMSSDTDPEEDQQVSMKKKTQHLMTLMILVVTLILMLVLLWTVCGLIQRTAVYLINGLIVISFVFLLFLAAGYISAYYGWFSGTSLE